MFRFLKEKLQKIYSQVTLKFAGLFSGHKVDQATLTQLEKILLEADTGMTITRAALDHLKNEMITGRIKDGLQLKTELALYLKNILKKHTFALPDGDKRVIYILVGINGAGKTTCAAKLAHFYQKRGKKVLLAAADTFRAAAVEQLESWANRIGVAIVRGTQEQDPSSVVFAACRRFVDEATDVLVIDTAGRLQNKSHLMREMEKVKKVILKHVAADTKVVTLLTVDAMLGQNSFDQAKVFNEALSLDGVVLTKMDGTGRGGIVFAISQLLGVPVAFISFGEKSDQFDVFNSDDYVNQLLGE